jgi:MFS family permease
MSDVAVAPAATPALSPPVEPRVPWQRVPRPVVVTAAVSLVLTTGFLLLPLAGTDLAAQVARGHFFRAYGARPVDFRWYGGVYPFGYSALTGPLNAALGSRGVGAVSCVVSAAAFAWVLVRVGVRRPTLGGVLAAVVGVFNLVSGRTTFALGIAFGMLALAVLVAPLSPRARLGLAALLAALSAMGSPVAGLFTGLCGTALLLSGRVRAGLALGGGAGLALVPPAVLFRDGGIQPYTEEAMKLVVACCVATFFLVPRRWRALRIGIALAGLAAVAFFYFPSPVGSNIVRLPMLYAAPIVVAVSALDRRWIALAVAALCWWQPPLVAGDLGNAGDRAAHRDFFTPLIDQLTERGPVGRVEVVPLHDHWESTYVAEAVPIARGWLRQVDVDRNPIFYDNTLGPATYLTWLYRHAISFVALPRSAGLDFSGREERTLIEGDLPYLRKVWENGDWILYDVIGSTSLVEYPGRLVSSDPAGVTFDTAEAAEVLVRVRHSRWLTIDGPRGCFVSDGPWILVKVSEPGRYRVSSSLDPGRLGSC